MIALRGYPAEKSSNFNIRIIDFPPLILLSKIILISVLLYSMSRVKGGGRGYVPREKFGVATKEMRQLLSAPLTRYFLIPLFIWKLFFLPNKIPKW